MLIWFGCSRSYLVDVVEAALEDNSSSMASLRKPNLNTYTTDQRKEHTTVAQSKTCAGMLLTSQWGN